MSGGKKKSNPLGHKITCWCLHLFSSRI